MRSICLLLLASGCIVQGGEEGSRELSYTSVGFVHWAATLDDGTDVGSGCVLTSNKDSYGDYLLVSAEPGSVVTLTETFRGFSTSSEEWAAHGHDDAYWCAAPNAERWSSIRNPGCWTAVGSEQKPGCVDNLPQILETEVFPAGDYDNDPDTSFFIGADGFTMKVQVEERGRQCFSDCGSRTIVGFFLE